MRSKFEYVHYRVTKNVNSAITFYMMACYAYYVLDDPFMSDADFDWLVKFVKKNYGKINHPHKQYVTLDVLDAGTAPTKYPGMVVGGTLSFLDGD